MKSSRCAMLSAAAVACAAGLAHGQSYAESFEGGAIPASWTVHNQSVPGPGLTTWSAAQNINGTILPHSGVWFANCNFNCGTGVSTLSNWLVMPTVVMNNGDTFSFWTRTTDGTYPDRLQLRMSTSGTSVDTGTTETSVGAFTSLLVDVNPTYTTTGYPVQWQQFQVIVSGLSGPTPGRFAFRYFVENGGPDGARSDSIGIDDIVYTAIASPLTGACCLAGGSCTITSSAGCAGQSGVYRGDNTACATANCPQPTTGACCLLDGTCALRSPAQCLAQNGLYRGDNSACAAANCPHVYNYTGAPVSIPDGTTTSCGPVVFAAITVNDSFTITSADAAFFVAHTYQGDVQLRLTKVGGPTVSLVDRPGYPQLVYGFANTNFGFSATSLFRSLDSAPYLYDAGSPGAPSDGVVGQWRPESPLSAFIGLNAQGTWRLEADDCYASETGTINNFVLSLGGVAGPAPCYANCDGSTVPPILNVNDFICFQTKYAQNDTYANCDGSTVPPVLNVNDFICFQTKYAQGCP